MIFKMLGADQPDSLSLSHGIYCPHCKRKVSLAPDGARVKCPLCNREFTAPENDGEMGTKANHA